MKNTNDNAVYTYNGDLYDFLNKARVIPSPYEKFLVPRSLQDDSDVIATLLYNENLMKVEWVDDDAPKEDVAVAHVTKSRLSQLHNDVMLSKIMKSVSESVETFTKPKIDVSEITINDDSGVVSFKFDFDVPYMKPEYILALLRVVRKAAVENEEEILNG